MLNTNLLSLIRYEWTGYWRRLRRVGSASTANQGIVLLVLALFGIKYFQLVSVAAQQITVSKTAQLSALLAGLFVVLIFSTLAGAQSGLAPKMLLHLPLSSFELFIFRLLALLVSPVAWLIVIGAMAISYPLASGANPFAGVFAGLLFLIASWQIGVAVSQLLGAPVLRKALALLTVAAFIGVALYFRSGGLILIGLDQTAVFYPARLVIDAALGERVVYSLTILSLTTAAAVLFAFFSFRLGLGRVTTRSRRRKPVKVLLVPGRLGGLVRKDLRYFPRLLDIYLGVLASALGCFHLLVAEFPAADVVRIFIFVIFLMNSGLAFNLFGLDDRESLARYNLLPLSGRAILLSKNLAFAITVGVQFLPLLIFTLWRLGLWQSFSVIAVGLSSISAYLAWGNWMSVAQVQKLTFFRFSSSSRALADAVGGLIFGSVPCVVANYAFRSPGLIWIFVAVGILAIASHFVSLVQFGKSFERRREGIAAALT
jgi:hypothetical protein